MSESRLTWFRITWAGKTSRKRGFELIEAETANEAERKFESLSETRRIEKTEIADIADYIADEPSRD